MGTKFSTLAIPYIMGGIRKYNREALSNGGLKLSRKILDNRNKINKLLSTNNYNNNQEIADELGISIQDVNDARVIITSMDQSTNSNNDEGESIKVQDIVKYVEYGYDEIANIDDEELIQKILEVLPVIHREMLEEVFCSILFANEKIPQRELAVKYGLSQSYVSRILKNTYEITAERIKEMQCE